MFFNIRVFLGKDKNGDFMNIRTDLVTEENLTQSPDIKDLKTEKKANKKTPEAAWQALPDGFLINKKIKVFFSD